jgi:hypothetical protein
VVLERVAVAAVDHKSLSHTLLGQRLLGSGDALGVVVCALGTTSEDNEAVMVALSADNGDDTGLGDGKEVMGVLGSANGVNGHIQRAISAVLEADGETETTGKLTVKLALGGTGANGTH